MAMATSISESFDYAAAPAEVFAMICTPAFQQAKCEESHALSHQVDVRRADGRVQLTCNRRLSTENLRLPAGINLGSALEVRETQDWAEQPDANGRYDGRISVSLAGVPLTFGGTLAMAAGGSGTVEQVRGELKSSVPLFGATVERAAQPAIIAGISIEQQVGTRLLATPA